MMKNIKRYNFNLVNNLFELKKLKKENREIKNSLHFLFYVCYLSSCIRCVCERLYTVQRKGGVS